MNRQPKRTIFQRPLLNPKQKILNENRKTTSTDFVRGWSQSEGLYLRSGRDQQTQVHLRVNECAS